MSVLSTILPTDVHADMILRSVEEGSLTRDRAEALAAGESGELLYAVRVRLNALAAFTDLPTADDFATTTCSECGWTCAATPSGKCALCGPREVSACT